MKREINRKVDVWHFLNDAKVVAVQTLNFTKEKRIALKQECDDLFKQATGSSCCPAWWIGGW